MTPWGKQSGGHFNPAITFAFYRLGKVKLWDAVFYATAQFSGAASGVAIAAAVLHNVPQNEAVRYAVTAPGVFGNLSAFVAELMISFTLMSTILFVSNHRSLAQFTPYFVGALYATYITKPAPKVHSVQSANVSQAITTHRPGSWCSQGQVQKAGDVQQIAFVSRRSELSSSVSDAHEFDRAEAIGKMDRQDRYNEQRDGRNTHESDKCVHEDVDTSEDLGDNGDPSHQLRCRNSDRVQDQGKGIGIFGPLRDTVCRESVADN
jgi:Major intrinsic protein